MHTPPVDDASEDEPLLVQNPLHNTPFSVPKLVREMEHPPEHVPTPRLSHRTGNRMWGWEAGRVLSFMMGESKPVFEIPPRILRMQLAM